LIGKFFPFPVATNIANKFLKLFDFPQEFGHKLVWHLIPLERRSKLKEVERSWEWHHSFPEGW
jgi:hypothetical protein